MPNLTFLAPAVSEIWRGPKMSFFGSRRKVISEDAVGRVGTGTGRLLHARKAVAHWSGETISFRSTRFIVSSVLSTNAADCLLKDSTSIWPTAFRVGRRLYSLSLLLLLTTREAASYIVLACLSVCLSVCTCMYVCQTRQLSKALT